jgi:hypothetical protein
MTTPGYSGTPLAAKLGIRPGALVWTIRAPREYPQWVAPLPPGAILTSRGPKVPSAVHVFAARRADLARDLARLRKSMVSDGFVWVSWPKKAARVATDITEDVVRAIALPMGFVDVKVCAVSSVWSGLKLVIRASER